MKNVFVSILTAASLALAEPPETRQESIFEATDRLLFNTDMSEFQAARNARNPPTLDWFSDGCTRSPERPLGYKFTNSCHRHDFGYQNFEAQGRFRDGKLSVDRNFRRDLHIQCSSERFSFLCRRIADIYYFVVSRRGNKRSVEARGEMERAMIEVELEKIRLELARARSRDEMVGS